MRAGIAAVLVLAASGGWAFAADARAQGQPVWVKSLETEGARDPLGINVRRPRLSWQLGARIDGVRQSAFEVRVASTRRGLSRAGGPIWRKRVKTSRPWLVYGGPKLRSRREYWWSVRASYGKNRRTGWSAPATFETALLESPAWRSKWIAQPGGDPAACEVAELTMATRANPGCIRPDPLLRREFGVKRKVKKARLYASGLGYGIFWLNGKRVGRQELSPSFTDYGARVPYVIEDVTRLLRQGRNAIGAELGRGFYSITESGAAHGYENAEWHSEPVLRLELHITYRGGKQVMIGSGPVWRSTAGPVVYDNLYRGETFDGIREDLLRGWTKPRYDDSSWSPVVTRQGPAGGLRAQSVEAERVTERRRFISMSEPEPGVFVLDLGQNVSGWTRIQVRGPRGQVVGILHGERLGPTGRVVPPVGDEPRLINPDQTDFYRLSGRGRERYRPRFVYHGFRYVEITGWPQGTPPTLDDFRAEIVHTDLKPAGSFQASERLLGRIVRNTGWAIRQNAHGFPTDTPVFEKTGWTGDGQIMAPSWAWLFDTERFHAKWSADLVHAQGPGGSMPVWAPASQTQHDRLGGPTTIFPGQWPGWDVALFSVPRDIYRYHGNARPLSLAYEAMKRYVSGHAGSAPDGALPAIGFGDWARVRGAPLGAWPDANAWWYEMHMILARTARVVGSGGEAAGFKAEAKRIAQRFNELFLDRDAGIYRDPSDTEQRYSQHVNALALGLGLVPANLRATVADNLAADVESRGDHLNTGVIGTRFLWPALSRNGHLETALRTATQTSYPSYGYWITKRGWTALGERWERNARSLSHHFLGTIVQWLFEDLAGIQPLAPGFAEIAFRPEIPRSGLGWVRATHESPRGPVASAWRRAGGGVKLTIEVPPNAVGIVEVPGSSRKRVTAPPGSKFRRCRGGRCIYKVRSGKHLFRARSG